MLIVSAIMLSTASYAWFASSYTVGVNEMHVKVKSNARFLEIAVLDGEGNPSAYSSAVTIGNNAKDAGGNLTEGWIELIHANLTETAVSASLEWQTGSSNSYEGKGAVTGTTSVSENTALKRILRVRMSETSTGVLNNLTVDQSTISIKDSEGNTPTDALAAALRILVVAKDGDTVLGYQIYDPGNGSDETASLKTYNGTDKEDCLIETVELQDTKEYYTLEVYIFFDGEDANATTSNTVNLQELVVNFSLTAATA
jgi:hypothetical protein